MNNILRLFASEVRSDKLWTALMRVLSHASDACIAAWLQDINPPLSSETLTKILDFLVAHRPPISDVNMNNILRLFVSKERPPMLWASLMRLLNCSSDECILAWMDTKIQSISVSVLCTICMQLTDAPETKNTVWELCYQLLRKRISLCHAKPWGSNATIETIYGDECALSKTEVHTLVGRVHQVCMNANKSPVAAWAQVLFCTEMLNILCGFYLENKWRKLDPIPLNSQNQILAWAQEHDVDVGEFKRLFAAVLVLK
jgi:hypothetical protein